MNRIVPIALAFILISFLSCTGSRKSSSCNIYEEIEQLQERSYLKLFRNKDGQSSFSDTSLMRKTLDSIRLEYEKNNNFTLSEGSTDLIELTNNTIVHSKYQDKYTYWWMGKLFDTLSPIFKQYPIRKKSDSLYFATLFSEEINAEIYNSKCNNSNVVIFNKRLFDFCLVLSKCSAAYIPFLNSPRNKIDTSQIIRRILEDTAIKSEFSYALRMFTKKNLNPYTFTVSPYHTTLAIKMLIAEELFVFAHEYSHIYLDHFNKLRKLKSAKKDLNRDKKILLTKWQFELDADRIAFEILNKFYDLNFKNDLIEKEIGLYAPLNFLLGLHILEDFTLIANDTFVYISDEMVLADYNQLANDPSVKNPTQTSILNEYFIKTEGKSSVWPTYKDALAWNEQLKFSEKEKVNYSVISDSLIGKQHPPALYRYNHLYYLNRAIFNKIDNISPKNIGKSMTTVLNLLYYSIRKKIIFLNRFLNSQPKT